MQATTRSSSSEPRPEEASAHSTADTSRGSVNGRTALTWGMSAGSTGSSCRPSMANAHMARDTVPACKACGFTLLLVPSCATAPPGIAACWLLGMGMPRCACVRICTAAAAAAALRLALLKRWGRWLAAAHSSSDTSPNRCSSTWPTLAYAHTSLDSSNACMRASSGSPWRTGPEALNGELPSPPLPCSTDASPASEVGDRC
mmetsp:Transcript_27893/g.75373  ORF Transcript_27893/g.75373 Transcript_27893/m.75373 type:complete len:202 (+) Transcript_27893:75-680(+)